MVNHFYFCAVDGDFGPSRLWDGFLPDWRAQASRPQTTTPRNDTKLLEYLKGLDAANGVRDVGIDASKADFMKFWTRG